MQTCKYAGVQFSAKYRPTYPNHRLQRQHSNLRPSLLAHIGKGRILRFLEKMLIEKLKSTEALLLDFFIKEAKQKYE